MTDKDIPWNKVVMNKKYQDIIDFSCLSTRVAIITALVITVIVGMQLEARNYAELVEELSKYYDAIAIGLIGLLGFSITGLALLTATITNKVVNRVTVLGGKESLERILLSFYLLGIVLAVTITGAFVVHFIEGFAWKAYLVVVIILCFLVSYMVVFSIFYAVELVRDCITLFFIINQTESVSHDDALLCSKFDDYKLLALESVVLKNGGVDQIQQYKDEIKRLIEESAATNEEKSGLLSLWEAKFK